MKQNLRLMIQAGTILSGTLLFYGCGSSLRTQVQATWVMTQTTCNGVVDTTIKNGIAAGASITLVIDSLTYTKTSKNSSCSQIEQGTYIVLPGETGLSLTATGQLGCTPSSCTVSDFSLASTRCNTTLSSSTTPSVVFTTSDKITYATFTYSAVDCDNGGIANDTKIETYQK